jgi:hypothetical protein
VLNIGIEVMLIVSQKKRSAEVDDTDGLLAHWLAPIGTVMESKRARPHGLWTKPSVSHSLSPHRHELPGYGIRSDCESVLAGGSGDRFSPVVQGKWFGSCDTSGAASRRVGRTSKRGFGCMLRELIAWIVPGSQTAPDCLPQTVADLAFSV